MALKPNTFEIPYTSQDFPRGNIARRGGLKADWCDLIWAALTVGRPNTAYVLGNGDASFYEALFRLSLVRMALEQRGLGPWLNRTDAFQSLDPTEKGAVSYFLGMSVCKMFAEKLLDTTWLLHLDVFRDQLDPILLCGRSRPDLVGEDTLGSWHAFECKGRSSVPNSDDRRKAKMQAQHLVCVGETSCSLHVGAISYFRQGRLEFHWRDPEPEEDAEKLEPLELGRLPDDAWRHYYGPALALEKAGATLAMSDARADTDVEIQIHPEIREALMAENWDEARSLAQQLRTALLEEGFRQDGLKVMAGESWHQGRT